MSKAFGEQNPTLGEDPVSWQTFSNGAAGIPDVVGDVDWGKLKLDLLGEEGRSAVYDLGAAATRKFTLTENRYGTGAESATIQIRGDTSSFLQDDVLPAWETYTAPVSKGYRYVQVRATTVAQGWWLSGSISAANCIGAYQAKGAASYAASLVNLANPGTYDLTSPGDDPGWNTTDGWTVDNVANTMNLDTGITPTKTWSIIARFYPDNATGQKSIFYTEQHDGYCIRYMIQLYSSYEDTRSYLTSQSDYVGESGTYDNTFLDEVVGYVGNDFYFGDTVRIVMNSQYDGSDNYHLNIMKDYKGYFRALVLYNTIITDPQYQAVRTAMLAL